MKTRNHHLGEKEITMWILIAILALLTLLAGCLFSLKFASRPPQRGWRANPNPGEDIWRDYFASLLPGQQKKPALLPA